MRTFMEYVANTREFYHGTSSGANNENIASFRKGIQTFLAQGHGQGAGFYVWLDKNKAAAHCQDPDTVDPALVGRTRDGYPMLITVPIELNTENFDLDSEASYNDMMKFINDNWDNIFKKLPAKSVLIPRVDSSKYLDIAACKKNTEVGTITFVLESGSRFGLAVNSSENVGIKRAKAPGLICAAIQKYMPEAMHAFEQQIFNKMISEKGDHALKYVGKDILQPTKIECLINNQWLDVTTQDPQAPIVTQA